MVLTDPARLPARPRAVADRLLRALRQQPGELRRRRRRARVDAAVPAPRDHLQRRRARLATRYRDDPRVATVVLDERDQRPQPGHDEQLHEHGAGRPRCSALTRDADGYRARGRRPGPAGRGPAAAATPTRWPAIARGDFRTAVYLGSGNRYGSAREAALKMLEMTGGQVKTFPETYLGPAPRAHVRGRRRRAGGLLPVHATP